LILFLCFTALNRAFASLVRADETGVYPNVVLADLSTNQYFFEQHMSTAQQHVSTVTYYGSEELIMAGHHLIWIESYNTEYTDNWNGGGYITERQSWLQTPDGRFNYGSTHDYHGARMRLEEDAKSLQLGSFRSSLEALSKIEGFLYFIAVEIPIQTVEEIMAHWASQHGGGVSYRIDIIDDGSIGHDVNNDISEAVIRYSNVEEYNQTFDFFRTQPVYYIMSADYRSEQSHSADYYFTHYTSWFLLPQLARHSEYSLAFTGEFINTQNVFFASVRDAYIVDMSIIAASAVLAFVLLIVLLVGAGRQNVLADGKKVRAEGVHFSLIDKPYLDISLALVFCWSVLTLFIGYDIASNVLHYRNITAMNILFAITVLLLVPPVLFWLMSLVKRLKAGRFWKHTLIYAIIYSCLYGSFRFCVRTVKALWAGTWLTLKIVLISLAAFVVMFFIGIIGAETRGALQIFIFSVIFTAIITLLLLLYARRIHRLEQGARNAGEGNYYTPIDAGGGELGNIASSINNISAGINKAVEERMKSERLKTELITNVSHDIRTPLTSIITYTDLLEHEGLDCKRAPEYLDVLKQKSLRLKTLTDELFEAAKAATGNIDVNLTELNIVSLINQVLGELDNSIKSSGIDLRVSLPERLYAKADGRLMQRIMENLLSNVFKYSLSGSRVYLDAIQTDASFMRIDLKNISAAELNFDPSELTERFKRGDNSRADGGSGLGLSIVQSFVNAQGGKFEISIDGDLFKATVVLPVPSQPGSPQ